MSALLHLKNLTFSDTSLPVVELVPPDPAEVGAAGHWVLSSAAGTYDNIQATGSLGALVEIGTPPTASADGITVDYATSLDTGFAPTGDYTICFVTRKISGDGMLIGGNYTTGAQTGVLLNAFTDEMRVVGGDIAVSIKQPLDDDTADQWVFLAVRVSADTVQMYCPQATTQHVTSTETGLSPILASPTFAIGGVRYTAGFTGTTESKIAECIIFETIKTPAELVDIYTRTQARMLGQGVTLS